MDDQLSIETALEHIFSLLEKYSILGRQVLKDGTILIGRAPHIAPEAWLQHIFPPLNDSEINEIQDQLNVEFPEVFKKFLKISNGIEIFNTTFYIFGKRKNYIRDNENAWQPFNIITANKEERPFGAKKNNFFFGGYDRDRSRLYFDLEDETVYYCSLDSAKSYRKWDSFPSVLISEVERIIKLFDEEGKIINKDVPTTPYELNY